MTTAQQSTVTILTSGDPGWDGARQAWNLTVDQHPAAIALPRSAEDVVVAAVRFGALRGGGGSFGVVTAAELRLFPITQVCASHPAGRVGAASHRDRQTRRNLLCQPRGR